MVLRQLYLPPRDLLLPDKRPLVIVPRLVVLLQLQRQLLVQRLLVVLVPPRLIEVVENVYLPQSKVQVLHLVLQVLEPLFYPLIHLLRQLFAPLQQNVDILVRDLIRLHLEDLTRSERRQLLQVLLREKLPACPLVQPPLLHHQRVPP